MNNTTLEETLAWVPVTDFEPGRGWKDPIRAQQGARACCEQLESGRILFLDSPLFEISGEDQQFLLSRRLGDSRLHKNISYRPAQDRLAGYTPPDAASGRRMHEWMRDYSRKTARAAAELLSPYAAHWTLDYASFRPEAEEGRKLPLRKRNDLLHVDAFPSRPTQGGRILRCFTNINPSEPRVWLSTDGFEALAKAHARRAGLEAIAHHGPSVREALTGLLKRALGLKPRLRTPYDSFMLVFHNYLKENAAFQRDCSKVRLVFPPRATWLCFTDAVPHAVLSGQFALEQTFIVPIRSMLEPEKSPVRVLESLVGLPLVTG